jgi:hypothetical protein
MCDTFQSVIDIQLRAQQNESKCIHCICEVGNKPTVPRPVLVVFERIHGAYKNQWIKKTWQGTGERWRRIWQSTTISKILWSSLARL